MNYPNNPNINRIKVYATRKQNRIWRNATVLILTTASFLLACYLTDKGYKSCLEAGKYSTIECEKLHLG